MEKKARNTPSTEKKKFLISSGPSGHSLFLGLLKRNTQHFKAFHDFLLSFLWTRPLRVATC